METRETGAAQRAHGFVADPAGSGRSPMTYTAEQQRGVTVLRVQGELNDEADFAFVADVSDRIHARGSRMVVDLSQVPFVNSQGLGALVQITAKANLCESRVIYAGATPLVMGVIETTRLHRFLTLAPTVEAALAQLEAPAH